MLDHHSIYSINLVDNRVQIPLMLLPTCLFTQNTVPVIALSTNHIVWQTDSSFTDRILPMRQLAS
jgi:hypothetical protein